LRLAAESGDPRAQYLLGKMYGNGYGVAKYQAGAVSWYRKAAEQGYASAQAALGWMYANGRGVTKDEAEAVKWYRKAAEQDDAWAQGNLGFMYANGRGVAKDEAEAVKWYRLAADQGDASAQYNLGQMYAEGRAAASFHTVVIDAGHGGSDNGDSYEKVYEKWLALDNALRVDRNLRSKGFKTVMTRKSDNFISLPGRVKIGNRYSNSIFVSIHYNFTWKRNVSGLETFYCSAASKPLAAAVQKGMLSRVKSVNRGVKYARDYVIRHSKNPAILVEVGYVSNSKEGSYREAIADGIVNGIVSYKKGGRRGVAKDEEEAVKWYRKAAEQDDASAQYNLGLMYAEGLGVEKNEKEAVKWYRLAADQGYESAQCRLGLMYVYGEGVENDDVEAVKWIRKAADHGYADAQYELGLMYDWGRGVQEDDEEAVKWYRLAADQGLEEAKQALLKLDTPPVTNPTTTSDQTPSVETKTNRKKTYQTARKIPGRSGYVFNPWTMEPVDVGGIPSGSLVQDPNDPNKSIHRFRVP